ncbi:AAA family ATPase [Sphingobacterium sp. UBA5670]|uniref:AAA family ATPase n=1 Tax=Sphingobacterium sp. UBA5670 TaxID=1947502 RepID=UPI0025CE8329|nr:ATP-binding protein [Sphingobacterium sp. UBA5670]
MTKKLIESLYLKNIAVVGFRSIHKINADFNNGLNIIIGKNGAGKSNLLYIVKEALRPKGLPQDSHVKALSFAMESLSGADLFEVNYERQAFSPEDIEINPGQKYFFKRTYSLNGTYLPLNHRGKLLAGESEGTLIVKSRQLFYNYALRSVMLTFPRTILLEYNLPISPEFIDLPGKLIIDFDMYEGIYSIGNNFLDRYFWNIETEFLDFFENKSSDQIDSQMIKEIPTDYIKSKFVFSDEFIRVLSKYTPIKNVRFNSNINIYFDELRFNVENIKIEYFVNDTWLPWNNLSDGTKRLFYIIAQIQDLKESVILIEEPELGIHPHQFDLLMQFIKERSDFNQIIISTHSPLVLNYVEIEELSRIQIVSYSKDSGTSIRRLSNDEREKARTYVEEVGYLSDYWVYSDLEE